MLLNNIENLIKQKNIENYEIYLIEKNIYETIFKKSIVDNEREIRDFEYTIRILNQKRNQTGIGIVKGCSTVSKEINKDIDLCLSISKSNLSTKYDFPPKNQVPDISIADKRIIEDPVSFKEDLSEELISVIQSQKDVLPTFGRCRIHHHKTCLRNSYGIDFESLKTFLFVEFSLKAEKDGKLAEYWKTHYFKELSHFDINKQVEKWAKVAKDSLIAKLPKPNSKAIVIFAPHVLREAINPVIGYHILGKAHTEKTSSYRLEDNVATEDFTLIDNGLLKGGFRTNSFDGEGNPQQRKEIIKDGVFKIRLYDQKYAILENKNPTGNGFRTEEGAIHNDISNLEINSGNISLDEIISNIREGYYIEQFSWLYPGELSGVFGAEIRNGYYIKNGKIQFPIKGGNVSGNVLKMIKNCKFISKEREFSLNSYFPYISFDNLNVSS